MSVRANSKLAIVGAGSVGASLAYAALIRGSARQVALYDIDAKRAAAEVLDLAHGTQFIGSSTITGGDDIAVVADADVIVITAGAKQLPGQTRLELAGTNIGILEQVLPKLMEHAPNAVYMLVTNPCDVLTVAAQRITGLPSSRVFSSGTVLDTSRLRWLLGERAGVSTSAVHALIVGEHGDSELPLWSSATIGPVPITDWILPDGTRFTEQQLDEIAVDVRTAAYRVIEGKGATNYAIGISGARIVEAILGDENAILPVSTVLDGYLGVSGVALSVPSIVNRHGVSSIIDVALSEREQREFAHSADTVREALASLGF
ncbi:L-lactate dehydrogenase [Plantibacter sp. Mn2098]|uniref:L-lactate dehydrogenase n=1 Tax=Plantibacter sp. Mn2098 TaxID=3395266 RepID=UPI003BCBF300